MSKQKTKAKQPRKRAPRKGEGRPSKFNGINLDKVKLLTLAGWTDKQMSEFFDVDESTWTRWKQSNKEFYTSLKDWKLEADNQVVKSLHKRTQGYSYNEVTQEPTNASNAQRARHDGVCELTEDEWITALAFFDGKCAYCGNDDDMTKDHVHPLKHGGKYEAGNIIPACGRCNSSKKDHEIIKWYSKQPYYSEINLRLIHAFISAESARPRTEMAITKIVTKQVAPSDVACIFWLKNRQPKQWSDNHKLEITIPGTIKRELVGPDRK